ncbi:hypothetical protein D3C81_1104500 [compost metagenome]
MHQHCAALLVVVQQLLPAQPVEQFTGIRGIEDFAQGVAFFQALDVVPGGQQVQVMVAQYAHQRFADGIKEAQGFQ